MIIILLKIISIFQYIFLIISYFKHAFFMRNIYINCFKSSFNMRIIINLLYKKACNIRANYKRKIFKDIKL